VGTNLAEKIPRFPQHCFWEITDACNLRCIHCEADAGKRSPDELSTDEALALADELVAIGCKSVNITGGEPFLRKDWDRIARHLADQGVNVTMITNGLPVDDACIERMLEVGVKAVSVSLDGDREVHDTIRVTPQQARAKSREESGATAGSSRGAEASSYDAAIAALERLCASPLKTAVITQVHRHNLFDMSRMYELLDGMGVDAWQVQIAMPLGRLWKIRFDYLIEPSQIPALITTLAKTIVETRDDEGRMKIAVADNIGYYGRLEPTIRGSMLGKETFWVGCLAGCRVLALCSNGDVKGCPSHPRVFVVGNTRETPLADIWADGDRFAYNTAFDETKLEGGCADCAYRRVCRAGCTSMAYGTTGTVYDNPFCLQRAGERAKVR